MMVNASADDDQGLDATLMTGADFYCAHHTPKADLSKEIFNLLNTEP